MAVGTRPEAIKLAPVVDALEQRGLAPTLIVTGQQPHLDLAGVGLDHVPRVELGCVGGADPYDHARAVESALRPKLSRRPRLIVVQGDTSSAYGAARAGFLEQVPVAHVEAGLRTHDPRLPWPEEEFRTAIDARAALLFAPTDVAAENLRRERVEGQIHVTGNSGIDALLRAVAGRPQPERATDGKRRLLVTCHRREIWGEPLVGIGEAMIAIAASEDVAIRFVLHPNPRVAAPIGTLLRGHAKIVLCPPLGHGELIDAMRASDLILSDSGGIQEEAPALGIPLLVLRDKTERPEGLQSGNARLVGTGRDRIVAETRRLLASPGDRAAMARPALPFGDGRSGPRIAGLIEDWLRGRRAYPNAAAPLFHSM